MLIIATDYSQVAAATIRVPQVNTSCLTLSPGRINCLVRDSCGEVSGQSDDDKMSAFSESRNGVECYESTSLQFAGAMLD